MITFCHVCLNMYFLTGGLYRVSQKKKRTFLKSSHFTFPANYKLSFGTIVELVLKYNRAKFRLPTYRIKVIRPAQTQKSDFQSEHVY